MLSAGEIEFLDHLVPRQMTLTPDMRFALFCEPLNLSDPQSDRGIDLIDLETGEPAHLMATLHRGDERFWSSSFFWPVEEQP